MICPNCGTPNERGGQLCVRCHQPMPAEAAGYGAAGVSQPMSASQPPPRPLDDFEIISETPGPGPQAPYPPPAGLAYPPPPPQQYQAPPTQPYQMAPPPGYPPAPPPTMARVPAGTAPRKSHVLRNVLLVIALLALAGLGAGAYLVYQTVGNKAAIPVARLIPAGVYGYMSAAPSPKGDQKAALDKLQDAFRSQPGFQAAWDKVTSQAKGAGGSAGAAFGNCGDTTPVAGSTPATAADFASYLGDTVSFAMLPLTKAEITRIKDGTDAGKVLLPKVLFFVDLDFNPLNKKGIVQRLKEWSDKPDQTKLVEKYKDVEIRQLPVDKCGGDVTQNNPMYLALVGGTAVVGFDTGTLHGVIDRSKDPAGSLAESPAWTGLDAELPKDRLGTLYLNLTTINETVQAVMPAGADPTNPTTAVSRFDGAVEMALSAHDDGFQIDTVSDGSINGQAMGTSTAPAAATLNDIPTGTWAYLAGADLKTTLTQLLDLYRKQGMKDQIDQSLADIQKQTGIDLEKDVLPLLGGDYLVSLQGQKGADSPVFTGGAEIVMKPGDGPKMAGVLDKLNKSMEAQGGAPPAPLQVGGATLSRMSPDAPFVYGLAGDKLFILASSAQGAGGVEPFAKSVLDGQGKGLGTDKAMQTRLAKLPAGSNGIVYVDIAKIRADGVEPMLTGDSKTTYDSEAAPFVRPFQYLLTGGATTLKPASAHTRGVVFLAISK